MLPVNRVGKTDCIGGMFNQLAGKRWCIANAEHLKAYRRTSTSGNQSTYQPGLQPMMVRVIVFFAKEHETATSKTIN